MVLEFYGRIKISHFRVNLATLKVLVLFPKPKLSHFPPENPGLYNDITETTNKLASRKQTIQDIGPKMYMNVKKHYVLTMSVSF